MHSGNQKPGHLARSEASTEDLRDDDLLRRAEGAAPAWLAKGAGRFVQPAK